MKTVKSVMPVQQRQGGWDVRVRYTDGTERLALGNFPYTLAQAQAYINNNKNNS